MGRPAAWIVALAVWLVVPARSVATAAGDPPFAEAQDGAARASSGVAASLSLPDESAGLVAGVPLRMAMPPVALPITEPARAPEAPASGRGSLVLDPPDGGARLAWRGEDPPPALHLSSEPPASPPSPPSPVIDGLRPLAGGEGGAGARIRSHALSALESPTAAGGGSAPVASERHWSSLPFLGEQARQAGYELPLPFGVAAIYNYVARDIVVTDVRVGVNGAPLTSVSQVANFKARSFANAAVVKTDAWLFPFLDVYLLLSYIHNSSDTKHRGHGVEAAPFVPTSAFQGCFGP